LLTEGIAQPISIAGIGVLSCLGHDVGTHKQAILEGRSGIRRMSELFGEGSRHGDLYGGWIEPRGLLTDRKWSPASMAALHVARQALVEAGWSSEELENTALVVGTSRGNAAGWLDPWPARRPFKLMAASNTIHSEPATAISIELGILGANHVVASGCSAGLDALGIAKLLMDSGEVDRALVVAVELPLVSILLDGYASSGLLGKSSKLDPYAQGTDGFLPAEGAGAIALTKEKSGSLRFSYFSNNSDGCNPVGVPKDGGRSNILLEKAIDLYGMPRAICPHATGTQTQAAAERELFGKLSLGGGSSLHLLKPYLGHTVGASGLLESALMLSFMREGMLPPNFPEITGLDGKLMPSKPAPESGSVFKLAHGMGGHNSLAVFHQEL
jgi:3-oxoacyl-[acyl-carrier-protein] synthase II